MNSFEKKVILGLKKCDILLNKDNPLKLGVAVSGGADSVSLLLALCNISKLYPLQIKVITINHHIREEKETCADAAFVIELCKKLKEEGFLVDVKLVELEKGEVQKLCDKRQTGIEECARTLRYAAFETFIKENCLDFLCLAHNQNDQVETLLMRFLQGSSVESLCGISYKREKYIRPMLDISRSEIEAYLEEKKQNYCTDLTNFDTKYLRNRIRNKIVPVLNEHFSGWQNAVINASKKNIDDAKIILEKKQNACCFIKKGEKEDFYISLKELLSVEKAIQRRLILEAIDRLFQNDDENATPRVPYSFLEEVLELLNNCEKKKSFTKSVSNIDIVFKNGVVFIKKGEKLNTDLFFSVIIEEDGKYDLPFGSLIVQSLDDCGSKSDGGGKKQIIIGQTVTECYFNYPVRVRSAQSSDVVLCANGQYKKVFSVFKDWKMGERDKSFSPLVQELSSKKQEVICILAKFLGFNDWIVKYFGVI